MFTVFEKWIEWLKSDHDARKVHDLIDENTKSHDALNRTISTITDPQNPTQRQALQDIAAYAEVGGSK